MKRPKPTETPAKTGPLKAGPVRTRAAETPAKRGPKKVSAAKTAPKKASAASAAPQSGGRVAKADVTGPIERESERILRIARELGEKRASRPLDGGWSVRDIVAHCIYWQGMLTRMMGALLPPPSWIPRWQSEHDLGTDELNRLTVEHYRPFAFETVLSDFTFTSDLVRRIVSEMKEENLTLEAGPPWEAGTPVWKAIAGETHGHWREHADAIEVALKAAPAARDGGDPYRREERR